MPTIAGPAAALAALAVSRDPQAWAVVVEQAGPALERLCARLTGDGELARDALQEALLHIRDDARGFRVPAGEPDPDAAALRWMRRVAANAALQLVRRRRAVRARECAAAREPQEPQPSPDSALLRAEDRDALCEELARLPQAMREAIVLHHVEGYGFAEVSCALRVPEGTAKVRVHRGLAVLRARLSRRGIACATPALAAGFAHLPAVAPAPGAAPAAVLGLAAHATTAPLTTGLSMGLKLAIAAAAILVVGIPVAVIASEQPAPPPPPSQESAVATIPAVMPAAGTLDRLARRPDSPEFSDDGKGTVMTMVHAHQSDGILILDVGRLRIALLGMTMAAGHESASSLMLTSPDALSEVTLTATGSTSRVRQTQGARAGGMLRVGAFTTTVSGGIMRIGDREFDALAGPPTLVVVGADQRVALSRPLTAEAPDESGNARVVLPDGPIGDATLASLRAGWEVRVEVQGGVRTAVLLHPKARPVH